MKSLLLICLLPATLAYSQGRDRNWFFGSSLGMQFSGNMMSVVPAGTSPIYSPYTSASYSDPVTGALLFYTNGAVVYNHYHQKMPDGEYINGDALAIHCYIVPHPGKADHYFIISSSSLNNTLYYALVDMSMNGGAGGVVSKINPITTQADKAFTVVKNLYDEGYWLITHVYGTDRFLCFRIGKNGIDPTGVSSVAGTVMPGGNGFEYIRGKMISNSKGTQIAFSNGTDQGYFLQVYAFDKKCGTLTFGHDLQPIILQADAPLAYPAFSPDGKLLYATWFYQSSQNFLLQYDLTAVDPSASREIIYTQPLVLGDMQLAPDGKIYMAAGENGAVSSKINVINNPDVKGLGCTFRLYQHTLSSNPNHFTEHFVEFITDVSPPQKGYAKPEMRFANTCEGMPVYFSVADSFIADSFRWHFGDGHSSTELKPVHQFAEVKDYAVTFRWYLCSQSYTLTDTVKLRKKPVINLGNDTTLCYGKTMIAAAPAGADEYIWNTGDTRDFIALDSPGIYYVKVRSGNCWAGDTISISYHPPIRNLLGDDFFICEKDQELVKLDAGEGFVNYKWTPTGDTTQWIIVASAGNYFVVVKDFRGCDGNDGTQVKRRCPVSVYFPDAFTPNKDGINDVYAPAGTDVQSFHLTVFNRWGEKLFETDELHHTWDGLFNEKPVPDGIYIYLADYSGYINKKLYRFKTKGNITLLR